MLSLRLPSVRDSAGLLSWLPSSVPWGLRLQHQVFRLYMLCQGACYPQDSVSPLLIPGICRGGVVLVCLLHAVATLFGLRICVLGGFPGRSPRIGLMWSSPRLPGMRLGTSVCASVCAWLYMCLSVVRVGGLLLWPLFQVVDVCHHCCW